MSFDLSRSRALWNRNGLNLDSDEVLAQILDRGEMEAWREIYRLATGPDPSAVALRKRIVRICRTIPIGFPHFFLAAMGSLGEPLEPYPDVPESMDDS